MLKKLPFALLIIPALAACSGEDTSREDVGEEVGEVFEAVGDPEKKVGEEAGEAAEAIKDNANDKIDAIQENSDK